MHQQPFRAASSLLLLATAALLTSEEAAGAETSSSTDVNTAITFNNHAMAAGYLFGMITPENPTTDFIAQIISPLTNGGGWGGVSFGASMVGPLLIATWPDGDKIQTSALTAHGYTPSAVTPYTAHPLTLSPIPSGSYINATHISSMFLCRGCINPDTFSPSWADDPNRDVFFAYAFSQTPVSQPAGAGNAAALPAHTGPGGGYGAFRVDLKAVRSGEYDKLAAMAEGGGASTGVGGPTVTGAPAATPEASSICELEECQMPNGLDNSHRVMGRGEVVALVLVGVAYLVQAFLD